jgi:diacylglycerol O-acyltransferase
MSGMALAEQLFDLEPNPPPRPGIPPLESAGPIPSDLALFARSFWPPLRTSIRVARYLTQQAVRAVSLASLFTGEERVSNPFDAPKVSWNGALGPRRKMSFGDLPLKEVRRVKDHFGVKVNDVMLAVVGGSLRRYLLEHEELPDQPLVASVPVSIRT